MHSGDGRSRVTEAVTGESDEVLTRVDGGVGLITLNRPKAINSLNQTMVDALSAVLTDWEADDAVRAVVLSGLENADCAPAVTWLRSTTAPARTESRRDGSGATSISSTPRSGGSPNPLCR